TVFFVCGFPTTLTLERAFPTNHVVELSELKDRDSLRHPRILQQQQSSVASVVDFSVQGTYDPYRVGVLDIPIQFYDPSSSSTASLVYCSDQRCSLGTQASDSSCPGPNNQCSYTFQYGDGSGTSGFYVSDQIHLDTISGDSTTSNASASIVFGCSMTQTGDLTKSDRAVDGIFGFGQQGLSVIAQLSSQGVAPDAFSHCLVGNGAGGGILVLGQIIEPSMVYTPLIPSQPHYNLNLLSISVNGQTLSIDPSMFATSSSRGGTIIDSGTTLAYLAEEAFDPFVDAITQSVSQSVQPLISKGNQCYLVTSSTPEIFPTVSLNFAGGASMVLRPQDYLLQQNSVGGAAVWCIGFQKIRGQGITILGDLVLKDRIVVYDLGGQRIGWANYDCTKSVNVSITSSGGRSEYVNAGQISVVHAPGMAELKDSLAKPSLRSDGVSVWEWSGSALDETIWILDLKLADLLWFRLII
ncbi:hypothetical protein M8C21_028875, partial [Ambrosia artemisiifolia]